jgi:hypothetical protein
MGANGAGPQGNTSSTSHQPLFDPFKKNISEIANVFNKLRCDLDF